GVLDQTPDRHTHIGRVAILATAAAQVLAAAPTDAAEREKPHRFETRNTHPDLRAMGGGDAQTATDDRGSAKRSESSRSMSATSCRNARTATPRARCSADGSSEPT